MHPLQVSGHDLAHKKSIDSHGVAKDFQRVGKLARSHWLKAGQWMGGEGSRTVSTEGYLQRRFRYYSDIWQKAERRVCF